MKIEEKVKRNEKKEYRYGIRCKIVCNCTKIPCEASGLKQCKLCKENKKVVVAESSAISMGKNNYEACDV